MEKHIHEYCKSVYEAYRLGNIETTYNNPITTLLEHFGCTAVDLSGGRSGKTGENIDIKLWHDGDNASETEPFAGVEVKRIGGIDDRAREQIVISAKRFGNVVLTDNLEWYFWHNGNETPYASVSLITLSNGKPALIKDNIDRFISLVKGFMLNDHASIRSSNTLAEYMAIHAKTIRDEIIGILKDDGKGQPLIDEKQRELPMFQELFGLYSKIKGELHPLFTSRSFADMFAQTIVYGLFIARYNGTQSTTFNKYEAIGKLQEESALLNKFFTHVASSGKTNPILESVIDRLCSLYQTCDISSLLDVHEDRDTIVHFYEDFLNYYDPALRKSLGIFYTPYPVAHYLVSIVDKILRDDFAISGGLSNNDRIQFTVPTERYQAADKTKEWMDTKEISVPRVAVLDPACGTGTFHSAIIKHIKSTYFSREREAFYGDYIKNETGLLSRLVGFEIMMTSYVVAHLNIRRAIEETLGSVPETQLPTSIFLTNTLAPPHSKLERNDHMSLIDFSQAIADEAYKADTWKARRPIKVIIGNPPYLVSSQSPYDISAYRTEADGVSKLKERNSKVLNDDYVKFFYFAQEIIERFGEGILAYVSPHGYIDNTTFRGMRASLLRTFDKIYVVNLHGNSNKGEVTPDGGMDENIFNIKQGIALFIGVKTTSSTEWATVRYADLWGKRKEKFKKLLNGDLQFLDVTPDNKMAYLMDFECNTNRVEYEDGICIAELFPVNVSGVKSGNDLVAIAPTREELHRRLEIVKNTTADDQISKLFGKLQSGQTVEKIRNDVFDTSGIMTQISFRPFDTRWTYYSGSSGGWVDRPREKKTIGHLLPQIETPEGKNVGIVFTKGDTTPNDYSMIFVSDAIIDNRLTAAQTAGNASVAPLYLRDEINESWLPNFDLATLEKLIVHMTFRPTPIQVFDYIYGILHDPNYRHQFNNLLKRDYPRVPIICNPMDKDNPDAFYISEEQFHIYANAGEQLRKLHLLYDKAPASIALEPNTATDLKIDKIKYEDGVLSINKNKSIRGISEKAWNFRIGGYQVLDKWFKSHKGKTMTIDDFDHISNVVGLLVRTLEIQDDLKKLR